MAKPLEKICVRQEICFVVNVYRPHRTRKGYYVWRKHQTLAGPFTYERLMEESKKHGWGFEGMTSHEMDSPHNVPLTENETFGALAMEGREEDNA